MDAPVGVLSLEIRLCKKGRSILGEFSKWRVYLRDLWHWSSLQCTHWLSDINMSLLPSLSLQVVTQHNNLSLAENMPFSSKRGPPNPSFIAVSSNFRILFDIHPSKHNLIIMPWKLWANCKIIRRDDLEWGKERIISICIYRCDSSRRGKVRPQLTSSSLNRHLQLCLYLASDPHLYFWWV